MLVDAGGVKSIGSPRSVSGGQPTPVLEDDGNIGTVPCLCWLVSAMNGFWVIIHGDAAKATPLPNSKSSNAHQTEDGPMNVSSIRMIDREFGRFGRM